MPEQATIEANAPVKLMIPRSEAEKQLRAQLQRGIDIKSQKIRYPEDLEEAREQKLNWTQEVTDLLNQIFDSSTVAEEVNNWVGRLLSEHDDFSLFVEQFYAEMNHRIGRLQLLLSRLEQARPAAAVPQGDPAHAPAARAAAKPAAQAHKPARAAVVVHNNDAAAAEALCSLLQRLGLGLTVVQNEQSDKSAIEQVDQQSGLAFAVVLTGPEAASARDLKSDMVPRACLRLAHELGFYAGRVGRNRLIVMFPGNGEMFIDELGVPYVPIDSAEGWQIRLARQLKRSGVDVDLNKLV